MATAIYIGCAGWSIRRDQAASFPPDGTHLQRYASRFHCVEINSSFYRSHRTDTYRRWADSTPHEFRFAVKLPKEITHVNRLSEAETLIEQFSSEIHGLGEKLGVVLVQMPPSLAIETDVAEPFFRHLRAHLQCPIVCEPRHETWFTDETGKFLQAYQIGRVAADPSLLPVAAEPGGDLKCLYFRWHGSPRIYYSDYDTNALTHLAAKLQVAAQIAPEVWCIFDNTAAGAATDNALALQQLVELGDEPIAKGIR